MVGIFTSTSLVLLKDCWRSRENWARKWLIQRGGEARGQRERRGFGGDDFLPVVADGIVGDGTGGIEEDVVRSPVTRGVQAQRELMAGREIDVELGVGRVADLRGGIFSGKRGELGGGGEDQGLIGGLVITGSVRSGGGLGHDLRTAVEEFDYVGRVEDVLVESGEEENLVALDGAADGASELLLAIVRLEGEERIGSAEGAVAEIEERGAVQVIGAGFGDDVDDGAAGASLFSAVSVGGDAELLHDFGGELVGSAVASASLGEESVVVVAAVDERGVLESANAAEREIAVGGGGEAARILRDAGGEQGKVGEAAAVQRQIVDCTFVEQRGNGAGLGFDQGGSAGDGDILVRSGDGEDEFEVGGGANVDMQLGRDLGRHPLGRDAGGVVAGRQQSKAKPPSASLVAV